MKTFKLSEYFQVVHPEYVYFRLKPLKATRNHESDKVIAAISALYRNILQRIHRANKTYFFTVNVRVIYYIYMDTSKVEFYCAVPADYAPLIKEKLGDTWRGITITPVEEIPYIRPDYTYGMAYKKEDALSIATDKRSNTLLNSLLSTIEVMEDGDRIGVLYNFIPTDQTTWRADYDRTIEKLKNELPVDKDINAIFILKLFAKLITTLSDFLVGLFNTFGGESEKAANPKVSLKLSTETDKKKDSKIVKTQIIVMSESQDRNRAHNNILAIGEGFKTVAGDNELIYRPIPNKIDLNKTKLSAPAMKMTPLEAQNFMALPGKELIESYKIIDHVSVQETEVPRSLQTGIMKVGTNTYRGNKVDAYLPNGAEYRNLTVCLLGPTRCGKTTLLQNLAKNAIDNGECVVFPDFISWCKASHDIQQVIPPDKTLVIDLEDFHSLPAFGFNELWLPVEADSLTRYDSVKRQTAQLLAFVDSINDKGMSDRMDNHLTAAANIVFSANGSFNDVFRVLSSHTARHEAFDRIPADLRPLLDEYVETLCELDDTDKAGKIIGTRRHLVAGIFDRVTKLKANTAMELMLKNDCSKNINLLEELQKPQLIVIRMPDSRFSTEAEKDVVVCYWFSKIWLTLQLRDDLIKDRTRRTKVNILWDELSQIPFTQGLLKSKLSQIAKFDGKNIISAHYINQIGTIKTELTGANTSYLLMQGCDETNFDELSGKLEPYTADSLINLQQYNALCCIKEEDGYSTFVVKTPPPVK